MHQTSGRLTGRSSIRLEAGLNKKDNVKASRREQRRAERRRTSLFWNALILGILGVAALLVVVYIVANLRPGPLPGEEVVFDEGRGEVPVGTPLTFQNYPPSSGTHYDTGAAWGFAAEPITEGYYLNNLARGGVVVLYECAEDCATLEADLQTFLEKAPKDTQFNTVKVIVSRYERPLPAPIVALAWGYQLKLSSYAEATLLTWYKRFVNQGPANGP